MRNAILAITASLVFATGCSPPASQQAGIDPTCLNRASDKIGGPFRLTSSEGREVTEQDFMGRKTFVFFGYTYCPDICPLTLYNLGKAMEDIPADKQPMTVLISVDPERDTPEALAQYIRSNGFPKDIVGLTGTKDTLDEVNSAFMTHFSRDDDGASATAYTVTHSALLYLMDENWNLATYFSRDASPDQIARCVMALS